MPVPARRLPSGTILVQAPASHDDGGLDQRAVLYARVSAHDQRDEPERQVTRLSGWAATQGVTVAEVVTEVGSGLNGRRPSSGGCSPTRGPP
jgi:putative resolvase